MPHSLAQPLNPTPLDALPALKARAEKFGGKRTRLRLIITIPILMMTFPLVSGVLHYQFIMNLAEDARNPDVARILQQSLLDSWWVTAGLLLVSLFCGVLLAHYITHPLHQLAGTLRGFMAGHELHEVRFQAQDELAELGNSFNHMVKALNRTIEERNRIILECYTGGLITLNNAGQITAANSSAEEILEMPNQQLLGAPFCAALEQRRGAAQICAAIESGLREGKFVQSFETSIGRKDGSSFPLIVTTSPLKGQNKQQQGIIINFRDLTKYKKFHQRLNRTDRLATAGTLAMGVAHEIRNPLASIRGMAQLLQQDLAPETPQRQFLNVIIEESRRLDQVVTALLNFSQPDESARELCDLNEIARSALHGIRVRFLEEQRKRIQLHEKYTELPRQNLYRLKVVQAFDNILSNAAEIVAPDCGRIWIETGIRDVGFGDDAPRRAAFCEIANNGPQIPQEDLERIFEPFFTTREGGSGLGLSIAYQIITFNGGHIDVSSTPERTCFVISFPII